MAVGDSFQVGVTGYVSFRRETTWGTAPPSITTGVTAIEAISCGFKSDIASLKLDTKGFRGQTKRVQLDKKVGGPLVQYFNPEETPLLLAMVLGGGIVQNSLTGAFLHSMTTGKVVDASISGAAFAGLSFNIKKGDTVFTYVGGRIDKMKISAKVGGVAEVTSDFIFKDDSIGATDIQASLVYSSVLPFTFVNGTYSYEGTEASLTTTVVEAIQEFELTIDNHYVQAAEARKLGSNLLAVLPPTRQEVMLKISQRFDTTTTYQRFIQGTAGAVQLYFSGTAINAEYAHKAILRLPKVYYKTSDPVIAGSTEVLKSDIEFECVLDTLTSAGRLLGVTVQNNINY